MAGVRLKEHQIPRLTDTIPTAPSPAIPPPALTSEEPSSNKPGGKHNFFSHLPKDPNCEVCRQMKITRAPWIRHRPQRAETFGCISSADHKILNEETESRFQHRYSVVVQDLAIQWIRSCPCKSKSAKETMSSLRRFPLPEQHPIVIFSENSLEFFKSCEDLRWNHEKSAPH